MGKYNLMGVLGLRDGMSPTLRTNTALVRQLKREVEGADRAIKEFGRRSVVLRGGSTSIAVGGRQSGTSIASVLMDPNPARRITQASRLIQMEEARQKRFADQENRAQARADKLLGRQKEQQRIRFEKEATRSLVRNERQEVRAAQQVIREQTRAARVLDIQRRQRERQEARAQSQAERQRQRFISSFGSGMTQVGRGMWNTFTTMAGGAARLVTAPIRALGSIPGILGMGGGIYGITQLLRGGLGFSADMEQAQVAYETMLGSKAKANAFLKEQFQFAAKTPFEFQDTLDNSRRLLAYGFKTEGASNWRSVMPWMNAIGNAVSSLGTGQEGFHRLGLAIGQVQAKGRLMGEEIRQLTETGIPVVEILAKKLGKTTDEIMKGADAGIMAEEALKALYEGLNERYGGGMIKQSRTLAGLFTTARDNFKLMTGAVGDGIRGKIQPELAKLVDWFDQNPKKVEEWRARLTSIGYRGAKALVDFFDSAMAKVDRLFADPKFQGADFFGKLGMVGKTLIGDPLTQWWGGGGREWAMGVGTEFGTFVVNGITAAINSTDWAAVFGVAASAWWQTLKSSVRNVVSEVPKVAPGGESPNWGKIGLGTAGLTGALYVANKLFFGIPGKVAQWAARSGGGALLRRLGIGEAATAAASTAGVGQVATTAAGQAATNGSRGVLTTLAGKAASKSILRFLGTRVLPLVGAADLGWWLGRDVVAPGTSAAFRWTDANLPGGSAYIDKKLQEDKERWERIPDLAQIPTTMGPARKEVILNIGITRADTEDDWSLIERLKALLLLTLSEELENS